MKSTQFLTRLTAAVFSSLLIAFVLVSCSKKNEVVEPSNGSADHTKAKIGHLLDLYSKLNSTTEERQEYDKTFKSLTAQELKVYDDLFVQRIVEENAQKGNTLAATEQASLRAARQKVYDESLKMFGTTYNILSVAQTAELLDVVFQKPNAKSTGARVSSCALWSDNINSAQIIKQGSITNWANCMSYWEGHTGDNDCDYIFKYFGYLGKAFGNTERAEKMLGNFAGLGRYVYRIGPGPHNWYTEIQVGNGRAWWFGLSDIKDCAREVKMVP